MTAFLISLLIFLLIPTLLSRFFNINKLLPLVFLQLAFGFALKLSGAVEWLQARQIDWSSGTLASSLEGLGWLGVVMLVATAGSESVPRVSGRDRWQVLAISVAGFAGTCLLGTALGFALAQLYPQAVGPAARPWVFASSIGLALSVTALPVLAAIVRQGGIAHTSIGKMAMSCAVLDDLWLWLGMAVILSFGRAAAGIPWQLFGGLCVYLAVMAGAVRPALRRYFDARANPADADSFIVVVSVILLSAVATGIIGLHSIFGAFVAGAILPKSAVNACRSYLDQVTHVLLLPPFFILTGLRLSIDLHSPQFWEQVVLVTSVAILGKMVMVAITARLGGLRWRQSLALGSLMQCKGLMELIAINILLDAGILGRELFSALATMALISTFITLPLSRLLLDRRAHEPVVLGGPREVLSPGPR